MKKPKQLKATHAHHKPYRKRHYAVLVAFVALGVALVNSIVLYTNNAYVNRQIASQTISDVFGAPLNSEKSSVSSTYGFTINYDTRRYYAGAIDAVSGDLYIDKELSTTRAYETIRLSQQSVKSNDADSVKVTYYANDKTAGDLAALEQKYVTGKLTAPDELQKGTSTQMSVDGVTFLKTEWLRNVKSPAVTLSAKFVSYTASVHGSPFTVIVYQGLGNDTSSDDTVKDITFTARTQASRPTTPSIAVRKQQGESLIDTILMTRTAQAAAPTYTEAEKVSALYGPAVVKVYHAMAADISLDGKLLLRNNIAGGTGSGFIVSRDGYIATNGHVVADNAREAIVQAAFRSLQAGNSGPLNMLIGVSGLTEGELATAQSEDEELEIIIKKIYTISESRFAFKDQVVNLLVGLSDKQLDIVDFMEQTIKRKAYAEQETIKKATLKSADYGGMVLSAITQEFTHSDVALLKIEGNEYPMVKMGDMTGIAQGGNLNIIGYPGVGSGSNGLVSKTETSATLTTGKVSSHKEDNRGKQLIETDTEIGHGNSGGPAFDDEGNVVGIATYTADTGNAGDGTLNYIRDIKDFKELADTASVDYQKVSATQSEWQKGINYFYNARYKKALGNFAKVKELYPIHPKVAELEATAHKRIANGENIDDFPAALVAVLGVLVLAGIGATAFFIVRHRKTHTAYVQSVASGTIQPIAPGDDPRYVTLQPFNPYATAPVADTVPQQSFGAIDQAVPQQPLAMPVQPIAQPLPTQDQFGVTQPYAPQPQAYTTPPATQNPPQPFGQIPVQGSTPSQPQSIPVSQAPQPNDSSAPQNPY